MDGAGRNNDTPRKEGGAAETCGVERREGHLAIWRKINVNPLPAVRYRVPVFWRFTDLVRFAQILVTIL